MRMPSCYSQKNLLTFLLSSYILSKKYNHESARMILYLMAQNWHELRKFLPPPWHNQKLQYYFLKRCPRKSYLNPIPILPIHFWEITLKLYLGEAGATLLSSLTASVTASVLSQLWNLTDFWILSHMTPKSPFNSGDFKSFTKSTLIWAVTSMLCCLQAHGLVECKVQPAKDLILSSCY